MKVSSLLTIIIVCIIFPIIATPINKRVEKKIANKMMAYVVQLLIDATIFFCLYVIASLLGFEL